LLGIERIACAVCVSESLREAEKDSDKVAEAAMGEGSGRNDHGKEGRTSRFAVASSIVGSIISIFMGYIPRSITLREERMQHWPTY
jgi:hypothetical protein